MDKTVNRSDARSDRFGLVKAGGGPVHMCVPGRLEAQMVSQLKRFPCRSSGWAALTYSLYIGKRRGFGTEQLAVRPSSSAMVALGTVLLYFGWFGFVSLYYCYLIWAGAGFLNFCFFKERRLSSDDEPARHPIYGSDQHCSLCRWHHLDVVGL